jgi:hypothetical protein
MATSEKNATGKPTPPPAGKKPTAAQLLARKNQEEAATKKANKTKAPVSKPVAKIMPPAETGQNASLPTSVALPKPERAMPTPTDFPEEVLKAAVARAEVKMRNGKPHGNSRGYWRSICGTPVEPDQIVSKPDKPGEYVKDPVNGKLHKINVVKTKDHPEGEKQWPWYFIEVPDQKA